VEVPAKSSSKSNGDALVLLISGDGGWAGIDKDLSATFAKQGIPVIGLDSLRYFWRARTPQSLADDVDRILRFYMAEWNKQSVLLVGFSQGADVMPFAMNRLPAQTREQVDVLALLSPGVKAVFEFHLQNWLGGSSEGFPISPEILKVAGPPAICVYGEDDDESSCSTLVSPSWQVVKLPGGHHFDGRYDRLVTLILQRRRR
jgi:type IV secretory pathway VirJ component